MRFPLEMTPGSPATWSRRSCADQAVPDGADARTAARLQPDLHRLRPDPRVRVDDQAKALDRGMPRRRRRMRRPVVSICGGEPMIYPGIGELTREDPGAEEGRLSLHERHVHSQETGRVQAVARASSSTSTSTACRSRTTWRSSAKGSSTQAIDGIKAAKDGRVPRLHQHHRLQAKPTWPNSTRCSAI